MSRADFWSVHSIRFCPESNKDRIIYHSNLPSCPFRYDLAELYHGPIRWVERWDGTNWKRIEIVSRGTI